LASPTKNDSGGDFVDRRQALETTLDAVSLAAVVSQRRRAPSRWTRAALAFLLGMFAVGAQAATFDAKDGQIITKDVGGIKFHTYVTAGVSDHVIETPKSLILVDVAQVKANNGELKAFMASLGKPLARIYISHDHAHHWIGLLDFPNVPVYALPDVITFIREKGPEELARARQRLGEQAVPYTDVVVPEHAVQLGQDTIDGVSLVLTNPEVSFLKGNLYIEFPAQKAIIHHHLAYVGAHVPMPPIDPRIELLKAYQARDYNWVMAGHGVPLEGPAYFAKAIDYYTTLAKVLSETTDPAAAKARMKAAYPDYAGDALLDRLLPGFFKK
jgi:hypothetical protein